MFRTRFGLPGPLAHTGPEHTMWKKSFSSRSSSTEPRCFSKPDDSAWLTISQEWWVRAWEAPLVSLSRFISASVSRLIIVTALWAVLLSFHIVLMQFLLLYYYKYLLAHVYLSHTIYHNTEVLRNSKLSLLSAGGISYWERSALWPLCHPRRRSVAYSLLLTKLMQVKYHCCWLRWSWTLMVTLDSTS